MEKITMLVPKKFARDGNIGGWPVKPASKTIPTSLGKGEVEAVEVVVDFPTSGAAAILAKGLLQAYPELEVHVCNGKWCTIIYLLPGETIPRMMSY